MNVPPWLERSLWIAAVAFAGVTVVGVRASVPQYTSTSASRVPPATEIQAHWGPSLTGAARVLAAADPFRVDHKPSVVRYRPDWDGNAPPAAPPRPAVVLRGIVGPTGHWTALLDGIPGHAGTTLARAGDTIGGLRVGRIGRDTVVLMGTDTTWRLTVRRDW